MKINLPQFNKVLECEEGENLFQVLKANHIPIASSCNGDGVCGKCVVKVEEGETNLSKTESIELNLHVKYSLSPPQRISCQCQVLGPITLTTLYW